MMDILKPLFIITPVLLVLAIGIIGFVFQYQRRMLQHQEHLRQMQEAKQRQLLEATIQAQEDERRRVARDLHDEVGAMLALVKLNVHQLTVQAGANGSGTQVKKMLDDVMSSVRHISHDLLPVVLERMGLAHALTALKNGLPADAGIQLNVTCNQNDKRLEARTELLLYRVVQELLSNTLKHAQATAVTIELLLNATDLQLNYQDNGKGFDHQHLLQQPGNQAGLGLMNLQARLQLLNGTINFDSAPNSGSKAIIYVPIS
ncbi:sensor histidine kinase [Pontibacter sp. H259]|uniref:sensor histidine kinase n=1 Tax=Pontibacter sp. H259 TaxID=3133421 RepID=UPI0030C1DF2D